MLRSRYIMIGGFLGAGKTTAILKLAERYTAEGLRVGLITNDQSIGLVDTTILASHGFPTQEISGGCFCCKFNSLVEASERLQADSRPDVFLAEPVGSCTDLVATVSYPLQTMYGDAYRVAPLSVMLDPIRAQRILGLRRGRAFTPKVRYIYSKQMEEADLLVINKTDLIDEEQQGELYAALEQAYPQASVLAISARTGDGIEVWMEAIVAEAACKRRAMEIDYDTYADGEALLGWVNVAVDLTTADVQSTFDGNRLLGALVERIGLQVDKSGSGQIEIAHLKATLKPSQGNDLAVANLVRGDTSPELSHHLAEPLSKGDLILNLRAEGDPDLLRETTLGVLRRIAEEFRLTLAFQHAESFRPARPTPTYRLSENR